MNFKLVKIIVFILLITFVSSAPRNKIIDQRILRLIRQIFHVPSSGDSYVNAPELRKSLPKSVPSSRSLSSFSKAPTFSSKLLTSPAKPLPSSSQPLLSSSEPLSSSSKALPSSSKPLPSPSKICSGVCVAFHLCENGQVVTTGLNLLLPRKGLVDDEDNNNYEVEPPRECTEAEVCCELIYEEEDNDYDGTAGSVDYMAETDEVAASNEITKESKATEDSDYDGNNLDYSDKWSRKCGIRNTNLLRPRISGNDQTGTEEFPWMIMVLKKPPKTKFYDYVCGGSLIHTSAVLTAAHCIASFRPSYLYVRAGEWDLEKDEEPLPHQDRGVKSVVIHNKFYKPTLLNDIAILILKAPVELADNVRPICMPPPDYSFDEKRCVVSGWGKENLNRNSKFQSILKKVDLPIVPNSLCQTMFRNTILGIYFKLDTTFICAGGEAGRDTCKGDGGSPLVCQIPNTPRSYYQAGIVSWGIGCSQTNVPGAYVNVARYRDWIDHIMKKMNFETISYTHK
ncbi:Phenoloxidase-activating factor 2 [Pseudolycoriella hygida]|uniref:Phenoloxidase-activating factor 2 n=1 Tax=Pseudolycoriella hygida TaxID=35572 RepID=A0A9Q0N433_9DIPT|nr:Phenoloxidase-activating factor 2 [Pseudolycoriella hygida]